MKSTILKLSLLALVAIAMCPSAQGQSSLDGLRSDLADLYSNRLGCASYITSYVQNCVAYAITELSQATAEWQCTKARRDKKDCYVLGFDACGAPSAYKRVWTDSYFKEVDAGNCLARYSKKK